MIHGLALATSGRIPTRRRENDSQREGALLKRAGVSGLGIQSYLEGNKTPQPSVVSGVSQRGYPQYSDLYKGSSATKYSPEAVTIPKPVPQPTVKAKGPFSPSKGLGAGGASPGGSGAFSGGGVGGEGTGGGGGGKSVTAAYKQADDGVLPLLGLGAGGLGGWALAKKFLTPTLEQREKTIAAEIAKKQTQLAQAGKLTKLAPIGAAAAGALLLAALAAMYARRDERAKQGTPSTGFSPYDQTQAGFNPYEASQVGNFYG